MIVFLTNQSYSRDITAATHTTRRGAYKALLMFNPLIKIPIMNAMIAPKKNPSRLVRFKEALLHMLMPRYFRRAILMCSLAARLKKDAEHRKLAALVCKELSIDTFCDVNAMLTPMHWSNFIWGDLQTIDLQECKGKALTQAVVQVFEHIPPSLIYASERAMLDDIFRTIRASKQA